MLNNSSVHSQTQCPAGTAAGSYGCGPDSSGYETPSVPTRWAVKDGYGAYAFSSSKYQIFVFTINSRDPNFAAQRVMSDCGASGVTDCELLHTWKNACGAVGLGRGPETTDMLHAADARTKREAIELMHAKCQAKGRTCNIVENLTQCIKRKAGWETYTPSPR